MKRARVLYGGQAVSAIVEGDSLLLEGGKRISAADANYLPPVEPGKIIAVHLSYKSRVEEYQMVRPPAEPSYFLKPPSTLSHHKAMVVRPQGAKYLNYEGELAVVIASRCKGATLANALDFVAGYTIANDWGVHDFRHADRGSMFRVKGQDGFCPLGPFLIDAADVNLDELTVSTYVNGVRVQSGRLAEDMLFSIPYMIADISRFITLEPGDVILTGTPANSRPVEPGDTVEVEVPQIGRLSNLVVSAEDAVEPVGEQLTVSHLTLHVALAIPEDEAERQVQSASESVR